MFLLDITYFFLRFLLCACNWPYGCRDSKLIINDIIIIIIIIIIIKFQGFQMYFQSYKFKIWVNTTYQISGTKFIFSHKLETFILWVNIFSVVSGSVSLYFQLLN
jgi:hypothetical protein